MALIQVTKVGKIYRETRVPTRALHDVSLSADAGEFMALVGPSGSGKTTLLNLIGGLDNPTEGEVYVGDKLLSGMEEGALAGYRLRNMGFIFQSYNLIPVLTAFENVEFVMLLQGVGVKERRERAQAILEEVGLSDYLHRRPGEMSGGQQQRVAVARAIVSNPQLVLADEPTANLDSETGRKLLELMAQMNRTKKITFVFSTHDPMVIEYARRTVTLRDGAIIEDISKQG